MTTTTNITTVAMDVVGNVAVDRVIINMMDKKTIAYSVIDGPIEYFTVNSICYQNMNNSTYDPDSDMLVVRVRVIKASDRSKAAKRTNKNDAINELTRLYENYKGGYIMNNNMDNNNTTTTINEEMVDMTNTFMSTEDFNAGMMNPDSTLVFDCNGAQFVNNYESVETTKGEIDMMNNTNTIAAGAFAPVNTSIAPAGITVPNVSISAPVSTIPVAPVKPVAPKSTPKQTTAPVIKAPKALPEYVGTKPTGEHYIAFTGKKNPDMGMVWVETKKDTKLYELNTLTLTDGVLNTNKFTHANAIYTMTSKDIMNKIDAKEFLPVVYTKQWAMTHAKVVNTVAPVEETVPNVETVAPKANPIGDVMNSIGTQFSKIELPNIDIAAGVHGTLTAGVKTGNIVTGLTTNVVTGTLKIGLETTAVGLVDVANNTVNNLNDMLTGNLLGAIDSLFGNNGVFGKKC